MSDLTRGEYLAVACAYLRGLNSPCRTPEEGERAAALLETLEDQLGRSVSALTRAATDLDETRSQLAQALAQAEAAELENRALRELVAAQEPLVQIMEVEAVYIKPAVVDALRAARANLLNLLNPESGANGEGGGEG